MVYVCLGSGDVLELLLGIELKLVPWVALEVLSSAVALEPELSCGLGSEVCVGCGVVLELVVKAFGSPILSILIGTNRSFSSPYIKQLS